MMGEFRALLRAVFGAFLRHIQTQPNEEMEETTKRKP